MRLLTTMVHHNFSSVPSTQLITIFHFLFVKHKWNKWLSLGAFGCQSPRCSPLISSQGICLTQIVAIVSKFSVQLEIIIRRCGPQFVRWHYHRSWFCLRFELCKFWGVLSTLSVLHCTALVFLESNAEGSRTCFKKVPLRNLVQLNETLCKWQNELWKTLPITYR